MRALHALPLAAALLGCGGGDDVFVDDLGALTVTFADGTLRLEWPRLVANGDSVEARGIVAFSGASFGNCGDDFPGTLQMDDEGGGGTFLLRDLHPAGCEASAADGEIAGCFESPN